MYTMVLLALANIPLPVSNVPAAPQWIHDYGAAWKVSHEEHKPMAVFLAPAAAGPQRLATEGKLEKEVESLLKANYVCVFLDTTVESNKTLAATFELPGGLGIIISDRSGEKQAFRHPGDLTNRALERSLRRYSDPERSLSRTETAEDLQSRVRPAGFQEVSSPIAAPVVTGRSC